MRRINKNKSLKLAKSIIWFGALSCTILPTVSISSCDNQTYTVNIGKIDGTNWSGRNAGSFAPDDYVIDHENQVVTYKSAVSIHAYNLVLPNYVVVNRRLYKVNIGASCFANCRGIAGTIELNDFITVIPQNCFFNCTSLTGVVFHAYPIQIGTSAFANCFLLSRIMVLHDSQLYHDWASQLISIGDYAFFNNTLDGDLKFGTALIHVGESAFENCVGITSADFRLSNNITGTSISEFAACTSLESIYFSESMATIENKTFSNCDSLKIVYLPKENMDIEIKDDAFYGCSQFQNFSKTPNIISIGPGAFTLTGNIQFTPWDPKYHLDVIHAHTFSSCDYAVLKFWLDGPKFEDYAFANNFNLSVLDFTDFVVKESSNPSEIGKVVVPDWDGEHIFTGANRQGGVIYLPTNGVLDDGWIEFFTRNDIELSSEPTRPSPSRNGWRVQFGAPRVDNIKESEVKEAELIVGSESAIEYTFEGFEYTTLGEVSQSEIEDNLRIFFTPHIVTDSQQTPIGPAFPVGTEIIWTTPGKFDLKVKIVVSSLEQTTTIAGPISFFYKANQVPSLGSSYKIKLIK